MSAATVPPPGRFPAVFLAATAGSSQRQSAPTPTPLESQQNLLDAFQRTSRLDGILAGLQQGQRRDPTALGKRLSSARRALVDAALRLQRQSIALRGPADTVTAYGGSSQRNVLVDAVRSGQSRLPGNGREPNDEAIGLEALRRLVGKPPPAPPPRSIDPHESARIGRGLDTLKKAGFNPDQVTSPRVQTLAAARIALEHWKNMPGTGMNPPWIGNLLDRSMDFAVAKLVEDRSDAYVNAVRDYDGAAKDLALAIEVAGLAPFPRGPGNRINTRGLIALSDPTRLSHPDSWADDAAKQTARNYRAALERLERADSALLGLVFEMNRQFNANRVDPGAFLHGLRLHPGPERPNREAIPTGPPR